MKIAFISKDEIKENSNCVCVLLKLFNITYAK